VRPQIRHRHYAMQTLNCGEFCIDTNIQWFIHQARNWFNGKTRKERNEFNAKLPNRHGRQELTVFWPIKDGRIVMTVAE
jgi:hypothetical protein